MQRVTCNSFYCHVCTRSCTCAGDSWGIALFGSEKAAEAQSTAAIACGVHVQGSIVTPLSCACKEIPSKFQPQAALSEAHLYVASGWGAGFLSQNSAAASESTAAAAKEIEKAAGTGSSAPAAGGGPTFNFGLPGGSSQSQDTGKGFW